MRSRGPKAYRVVLLAGLGVSVVAGLIPTASAAAVATPPRTAAAAVSAGITDCVQHKPSIWSPTPSQRPRVSVRWAGSASDPITAVIGRTNKAIITVSAVGRETPWRGYLALTPAPYSDGISTSINQTSLSGVSVRRGESTKPVPRGCTLDSTGAKYARYAWPVTVKPGQTVTYTVAYRMNRMPPLSMWQFWVTSMPTLTARETVWDYTAVAWR